MEHELDQTARGEAYQTGISFLIGLSVILLASNLIPIIGMRMVLTLCCSAGAARVVFSLEKKLEGRRLVQGLLVGAVVSLLIFHQRSTGLLCLAAFIGHWVATPIVPRLGRWKSLFALPAVFVLGFIIILPRVLRLMLASEVSRPPPPFSVELLPSLALPNGSTLSNADLQGTVTVLDFWAHWCGPCQSSLTQVNAVAKRFSGDPSVKIIAVNIDWSDGPEPIHAFLKDHELNSLILGKPMAGSEKILSSFGGRGIPFLVIIDKTGTVRYQHGGFVPIEDLDTELTRKIEQFRSQN